MAIPLTQYEKDQRMVERTGVRIEKAKEKAEKLRLAKGRGEYHPYTGFDENGAEIPDHEKPYWFKNLRVAWAANKAKGAKHRSDKRAEQFERLPDIEYLSHEAWSRYLKKQEEKKRPIGRPRMPDSQRKRPKHKTGRSDKMRTLLKDNGIVVDTENRILGSDGNLFIGWEFQPNGRLKYENESTVSVHYFLSII